MSASGKIKKDAGEKKDFLVVGLGASAGGVKALTEFFALMPSDSGMAFVVILHLSEEHKSSLPEILQRKTEMRVVQVTKTLKVEPNNVYVIPPAKHLELTDGVIGLLEPKKNKGVRVPIDRFFKTLADAYAANAVSIILSGTGSDGTQGMKHVKAAAGFAIVQEPSDAEYDGMPRSAIETQIADIILPVAEMPEKLLFVRDSTERLGLNNGEEGVAANEIENIDALRDVITLLRVRTGHDFSNYKRPTLIRRVARHLQIHETHDLREYLQILRDKPEEVVSLIKNLLINVTNFFRDKDAFDALERDVIPSLFEGKGHEDQIRVWIAGCATGEEAYSIAILLSEHAAKLTEAPKIQIFASDVDEDAIHDAREGRFNETLVVDIPAARLKQFFVKEDGSYRIRKSVREMILFTPHNILRDPPFSRLDLVSCRNVMIYLNRDTQEKLLQVFHFALSPNGYLFLGSSESAEGAGNIFSPVDKKARIFQSRPSSDVWNVPPTLPISGVWSPRIPNDIRAKRRVGLQSFGDLHLRLVEHYAPPSVLVNDEGEILHLSENAGRYLKFVGGTPSANLLKVINPALLSDTRAALYTARKSRAPVTVKGIRVTFDGVESSVNLTVRPAPASALGQSRPPNASRASSNWPSADAGGSDADVLLVIFEEQSDTTPSEESVQAIVAGDKAMETVVARMEDELRHVKDQLRGTIEQYETSHEEMKASNEELQAINEELRSASEELETSKEELQSLNEELTTVNHELKDKIELVGRYNADLNNLVSSTNIATIFLDRDLNIKRFTPRVTEIFNVIPTDLGRPLAHITHRLSPDDFHVDAAKSLANLSVFEREVTTDDKQHFIARFSPYRTVDDRVEGVVVSFIDVTERERAARLVRETQDRLKFTLEAAKSGDWDLDLVTGKAVCSFRHDQCFGATEPIPDWSYEKFLTYVHPDDRANEDRKFKAAVASGEDWSVDCRVVWADGSIHWIESSGTNYAYVDGKPTRMLGMVSEVTERKQAEEAKARLAAIVESSNDAVISKDLNGIITSWNRGAQDLFGYTAEEIIGKSILTLIPPRRADEEKRILDTIKRGEPIIHYETMRRRKDGSEVDISLTVSPIVNASGVIIGASKIARDITERKQAEEALRVSNDELTRFNAAMVGREMRMVELKKEVNELSKNAGKPEPYALEFENEVAEGGQYNSVG